MKIDELEGYDRKLVAILLSAKTPKTAAEIAADATELCGFLVIPPSVVGVYLSGHLVRGDGRYELYWNPDFHDQSGDRKTPKKYRHVDVRDIEVAV